ncbi:hypothetical protein S40285_08766 [Stachybotrys chlorohalonatus IBT 40285]|uniref:Uncharacterized protein n=1 Tax=Stachybotrys chlorohalonatus (strain IBT 40285) TaxID=1283841 RepID=A0A084QUE3_STAC4|nr:hypothetical protein S40285_08766 [Stachybotrys chlorohalonata IBT 40285]
MAPAFQRKPSHASSSSSSSSSAASSVRYSRFERSSSRHSRNSSLNFGTPLTEQLDYFDVPDYTGNSTHGSSSPPLSDLGAPEDPISNHDSMSVAIVGMACRLPGNVSSPAEFWELCSRARSGYSAVPSHRFNHGAYYHPNPGKSGSYHASGGYFLQDDVAAFDAPFFGLTENEAIAMDPQQRLLLECTFEALENAGIPKHSIVGRDVGVFIGGSLSEYESHLSRDSDTIAMYQATGCAHAMQSNRLSHFFDLRGPSFTADTACSASSTAIHLAYQSLRMGESEQAIVGGCHLNLLPDSWISFSSSRLLSDTGKSYAFDSRGTGFGRGEGCGIIILKPLARAIADNDTIRAVILGSGINQDGKTQGITMPNGLAQEKLINQVYNSARLDQKDVGYVECHGTGTVVGDPIEATAIHNTIALDRTDAKDPLYMGSVKSNIGHLEAASGIAAVIKATMMLERGFLLPNHDFKKPNTKIPWKEWNMKVLAMQRPWPKGKKYISVNNFGFGGTNAHLVLGKAPLPNTLIGEEETGPNDVGPQKPAASKRKLFILSANDKNSLEAVMKKMVIYLEQRPEIFQMELLNNLAYTLGQRRSRLQWTVAISAETSFDLVEAINTSKYLPGKETEALRLGFVYTGQGAQWYGMGRELYENYPVYRRAIERADGCLKRLGADWSLVTELGKDAKSSNVSTAHISQPSCTAVQLALTELLRSWGIKPTAVAGHSSGEIGAAFAAEIISFEAAMTIAYYRGRLVPILKSRHSTLRGSMMAVGATCDEIQPIIDGLAKKEVRIACYNSPTSLTISGDVEALSELEAAIKETKPGTFNRRLQVDVAYHSHHMNLVAEDYREFINTLQKPVKASPNVQFHSSLYGRWLDGSECTANYWVDNLTCPVRFTEALESMMQPVDHHKTGVNMLIELGPHSALQGPIRQILKAVGSHGDKLPYSSPLIRSKDAVTTALDLAATLITKGALLRMDNINFPNPVKTALLTDLPRYVWNHQTRYWKNSRLALAHNKRSSARNDLVGLEAIYSSPQQPIWRNMVSLDDLPWLRDHRIQSVTVFPISGYISMAMEAASQWAHAKKALFDHFELRDVTVIKPLALSTGSTEITTTLTGQAGVMTAESWSTFSVSTWTESAGWVHHCSGLVRTSKLEANEVARSTRLLSQKRRLEKMRAAVGKTPYTQVDTRNMYRSLSELGVEYGPAFQGIDECKATSTSAHGTVSVFDVVQEMPYSHKSSSVFHPTFMESMIQMYWPVLATAKSRMDTIYLPSAVEKMTVPVCIASIASDPGSTLQVYCESDFSSTSDEPCPTKVGISAITSGEGHELAVIVLEGLLVAPIHGCQLDENDNQPRELCYKFEWESVEQISPTGPDGGQHAAGDKSPSRTAPCLEIPSTLDIAIIHGSSLFQNLLANCLAIAVEKATSKLPDIGTLHDIVSRDKVCIMLAEIDQPLLQDLSQNDFGTVQSMLTTSQGVFWVVRGAYDGCSSPGSNMISGLARSIRSETMLPIGTLDLDSATALDESGVADVIFHAFTKAFSGNLSTSRELEFMERNGKLFTPRIVHDTEMNEYVQKKTHPNIAERKPFISNDDTCLRMTIMNSKSLDEPQFSQNTSLDAALPSDQVQLEVKAIGVNSLDSSSSGSAKGSVGMEAAGIITKVGSAVTTAKVGDRVAALTLSCGAFATQTRVPASSLIPMPDTLSYEDAATLPLAYCTAYYALVAQARLAKDHRLIVHCASGGVGQAAISLAQHIGAEVFATVSSIEKKEALINACGIPEDHIMYSRDTSFRTVIGEMIKMGEGTGADVVLNLSTNSDVQQASWDCLNPFGHLINVGKGHADAEHKAQLPAGRLDGNLCCTNVDMMALAHARPGTLDTISAEVSRLLQDGHIRAVSPVTIMPVSELSKAFNDVLNADRGPGKLVVVPKPQDEVMVASLDYKSNVLQADATYLLVGGTGGLGRSMTRWMVSRGARNIVLLSRSDSTTAKVQEFIDEMQVVGANVVVRAGDVADKASVGKLFSSGFQGLPPVQGVIHAAMVLRDVLFEKMTWQDYRAVVESKVQGAWNLHTALDEHKMEVDFFIAISSVSGVVGNRGQAAYAAANTYLDALVQHRVALGLPAASLDLTAVSDAGYLADMGSDRAAEVARNLGSDTMCEAEVLALLQAAIEGRTACSGHSVLTGVRITPTMRPFWTNDAKFKRLRDAADEKQAAEDAAGGTGTLSPNAALRAAQTAAEAEKVLCDRLVDKISEVLMMDPEDLDVTRSLSHYPLDSLVAIEVRNFIAREFEANMQVLELLSSGSVQTLTKAVYVKSKLCAGF